MLQTHNFAEIGFLSISSFSETYIQTVPGLSPSAYQLEKRSSILKSSTVCISKYGDLDFQLSFQTKTTIAFCCSAIILKTIDPDES